MTGGAIERGTFRVDPGAEIKGTVQTATAVANLWAGSPAANTLRDLHADIQGTVRNHASTSSDADFHPANALVGGLVGWLGGPAAGGNVLDRCVVTLGPDARIVNETGATDAAGGAVGHIHSSAYPLISGLDVRWAAGATVTGRAATDYSPSPWCATYYGRDIPAGWVTGRVIPEPGAEAAFRALWPTYWLETFAPFGRPGFRLRLR